MTQLEDMTVPEIITSVPRKQGPYQLRLWKNLFIDTEAAAFYIQNHLTPTRPETDDLHTQSEPVFPSYVHSEAIPLQESVEVVICLLPWSELENAINYPDNVQRSGKIFIHFPIQTRSLCNHRHVAKSKCRQMPCGNFSPFLDMRAVTTMINRYMETGLRVLIYCHRDLERMLLFIGCCMVQDGIPVDDVITGFQAYALPKQYQTYIQAYADVIRQIP